jgi:hypothetical protein
MDNCSDSQSPGRAMPLCRNENPIPDNAKQTGKWCAGGKYVRLEIRLDVLYKLIDNRSLVIEDLRKLDAQGQRCVRQFLLDTLRDL